MDTMSGMKKRGNGGTEPLQLPCSSLKEDTVPEEREDDEVDGGEHPSADAPLGLDPVVHHGVPVLAGQDLRREGW